MGSFNILVPEDVMSLAERKEIRLKALFKGYRRAIDKAIGDPADKAGLATRIYPKSVDVRESQPNADFGVALGSDYWITTALAAVGTPVSVFFGVISPTLAANKLLVIYGVSVETVPMPVNRLTFRSGGAAGNVLGVFDLEQLIPYEKWQGFFSEPIVIDPTRQFSAQVTPRIATGVVAQVRLLTYLFEPAGQTIA